MTSPQVIRGDDQTAKTEESVLDGLANVEGPGWVDHSSDPIQGLFPLAVEQFLNAAVAVNVPGVTTVTNTARYYALHALIADEAQRRRLDGGQARNLLRRTEIVYALICMSHQQSDGHDSWYPAAHGRDRILSFLSSGQVDLDDAAGMGPGKYANAATGFLGPYFGSEVSLGWLADGPLSPGPAYDRPVVHRELGPVVDLAATTSSLGLADVADLGSMCLCRAATSDDGGLLAERFAGRPDEAGTVAGNIGQLMRLFATAMGSSEVRTERDLGAFVMFSPVVVDDPRSTEIWLRWRGIRTRAASVAAWRELFAHTCRYLNGGPLTVDQLGRLLAEDMPAGTLADFVAGLPPVVDAHGAPLPAELEIADRPSPERHLATLALGAMRFRLLHDTSGPVRLGLAGPPGHRFESEELSPQWVSNVLSDWGARPVAEFARWLASVMVNRAHRVTMSKSYWRPGRYVMPLRILLQDDLVVKMHGEATGEPPLRWTQLLSMGRQTGIFSVSDAGVWELGPRGYLLE
ncbi:hypothetical protein [Cellulomonas alba]|uniref:Uncharacterized protein n=1 Tax=Cellulomonas alba TaxID=3053467 RepID=A0ABT7SBV7_9CELL|nr:hypothetical protein [Cellulomonas alba]MDM7853671.1 hypothetical protein [Cellulomonas alba]